MDTNTFWNYIQVESRSMANRAIELLTFSQYDVETKKPTYTCFAQKIATIQDHHILRFPAGLTKHMAQKLNCQIERTDRTENVPRSQIRAAAEELRRIDPKFEVRDYQLESVYTSANQFSSLILSGVGTGKTSMLTLLCKTLESDKILILNTNNFILGQIYNRLGSKGITDVSFGIGKEPDYAKRIVIMNTALSHSRLASNNDNYINYLKTVNVIIWDEAQHLQAITNFEPILYTNPSILKHIVGYSGSPFRNVRRPYDNEKDRLTIALLGEPAFTYQMKDTIDEETIAQPYGYFIRYNAVDKPLPDWCKPELAYYGLHSVNIVNNPARNTAGVALLTFLNSNGIKTFASVATIKSGKGMMKKLAEANIPAMFVSGGSKIAQWVRGPRGGLKLEERKGTVEDIKEALSQSTNIILGTSVLDEGVDIEEFQATVLFAGGKSPISNLQRIGRSSRKKYNGQNISFVVDFADIGGNKMFEAHCKERRKLMVRNGVIVLDNVHEFCQMVTSLKETD